MKIKGSLAVILAAVTVCGGAVSCSSKNKSTKAEKNTAAVEEETEATTAPVPGVDFSEAVEPASGDAYLAIVDANWEKQYLGKADPANQLAYKAGTAHIEGNGDYTVSVTADSTAFQYLATGDSKGTYKVNGIGFAAVIINDGEKQFPNAIITVKSIKVDGREIELKKKGYTNTEAEAVRSNIFNEWISDDSLPGDARTAEGALFTNYDMNTPSELNDGSYSAQIVSSEDFKDWTTVEVGFTVSGL
ncbi:hypothetical protein [Ruminococcus flavefaciens]|uniref:Lipoprotein n=1 Tax=Ruminococcus flavefaciens 007c TaxID=1341157 RepID=W7UVF8_RUMFL|nr:hypothetical protein [Ruminococcus flavefaciens]EWM52820.1 hypothetical protein RF007C_14495 [Ruminococcus flavefaciens 007c]